MSVVTLTRCTDKIVKYLCDVIGPTALHGPWENPYNPKGPHAPSVEEFQAYAELFDNMTNKMFPGVVTAVDGTQVPIEAPTQKSMEWYFGGPGPHSQ